MPQATHARLVGIELAQIPRFAHASAVGDGYSVAQLCNVNAYKCPLCSTMTPSPR